MRAIFAGGAAAVAAAMTGGATLAQDDAEMAGNDYALESNWLCRPDTGDICDTDVTATLVPAGDGELVVEPFAANPDAPIDCFYVYPTVSRDQRGNSDMVPDAGEIDVALHHMARLSSVCQVYVPMHRQITLAVLRGTLPEGAPQLSPTMAYDDVVDAWNSYLEHDNNGRGVVLIGHSQGTSHLVRLIAEHIDGQPIAEQMLSAMLIGNNVMVPPGELVGGSFEHTPLCTAGDQLGCVISYMSFRDTVPPPDNANFGRSRGDNVAACVNPAELDGSNGVLDSYWGTHETAFNVSSLMPGPWTSAGEIGTAYVHTPGLLSAECVHEGDYTYLKVSVNAAPDDPRTDEIVGDVVRDGEVLENWGLHLTDVNQAQGNLIRLIEMQTAAYLE
ncbi:MAG: DUF3089 domain-containing protein [Maricaulaceae bacterium]|jgi:hypothetical protein